MNRWESLKKTIEDARDAHRDRIGVVQASLIRRLSDLAKRGFCDKEVSGWFTTKGGTLTINASAPKAGDRNYIPMRNLEHIDTGLLTIMVTFESARMRGYSMQLRGARRIAGAPPWYARVDLDEVPRGVGLCSHALLHTHVGTSPEDDDMSSEDPAGWRKKFSTRVPTPWLAPVDALNWLLAAVDRRLEVEPHPE